MEGHFLGGEVSSFIVGMEFRDSDEVGRRLHRLRSVEVVKISQR